jgi:hypothetical protein
MIDKQLEELRIRREKLEQKYNSLKRKQRCLQNTVNVLLQELRIIELEDLQSELQEISLPKIHVQKYPDDLAEKCRKALEVSFGEIPMPIYCLKKKQ